MASPEIMLISAMLRQKDHVVPASRGISSAMFHAHPDEFKWIERYITKHSRMPSMEAFKAKFPEFPVRKVDDVAHFCEEVRTNHARLTLLEGLSGITEHIRYGRLEDAIKSVYSVGVSAEAEYRGLAEDADIFENYEDTFEEVVRRKARREKLGFSGIPTGFPTIDEIIGGIQPGWFVVVAARLGTGKTWMLIRMAVAAAFSGVPVHFNSLEQTRPDVAMRVHTFASSEYGREVFRNLDLAQGKNFHSGDYKRFLLDMQKREFGRFHIADATRGGMSVLTFASQIERNRPEIMFIDYLTLVRKSSPDWQGTAELARDIQQMAQRYRVPIVGAAQFNRNAANKREAPGPEDLAESDEFGRAADLVLSIQPFSKRVLRITITKNRHGNSGQKMYVSFNVNTGEMEEITFDEAIDLKDKDNQAEDDSTVNKKFTPRQRGSYDSLKGARKKKTIVTVPTRRVRTK